jgi:hypothetical protein
MKTRDRVAYLLAVVLAVLGLSAPPRAQAMPQLDNGPANIKAGTIVWAQGTLYRIHTQGGWHTHKEPNFNNNVILGSWDSKFEMYHATSCSTGWILRKNRAGIWNRKCLGTTDSNIFFETGAISEMTSVG